MWRKREGRGKIPRFGREKGDARQGIRFGCGAVAKKKKEKEGAEILKREP